MLLKIKLQQSLEKEYDYMSFYEDLVMQSQMNYSRYYNVYASGSTPYELSTKKQQMPYDDKVAALVKEIQEADTVIIGGASGLSAAGGGDFYYEASDSYKEYFGKFYDTYGFNGAFAGMHYRWPTREAYWGYLATFLNTTQTASIRKPYIDLDTLLQDKEFFVITTNQDTQFIKIYEENKVSQIQGDHRFFQCARCCTDDIWDSVEPVSQMIEAMGDDLVIPTELIPRCPHCGGEAFPWVRGYGNFLQGTSYDEEYEKAAQYVLENKDKKVLFLELGVGRMTPMFIQEPFWNLTWQLPNARYIGINNMYDLLPKVIEDKGFTILEDISKVLSDAVQYLKAQK